MTEAEWLAATNPTPMWWLVEGRTTERQLRLVACACCRRIWHLLTDEGSKLLIEAAEQLADGLMSIERAAQLLESVSGPTARALEIDEYSVARSALISHPAINRAVPSLAATLAERGGRSREHEACAQTTLFHDIFGNPFRPVSVDPSWLTSTVVALAEGIYQERAFERLPILADALMDAGCDHADVLNHCRGEGSHVRGCWVVDLLTGRM